MITFDPFWRLTKERGISVYSLEYEIGLNPAEISRLKHNHNYTLRSIDKFCTLFHCQPGDLLLYTGADNIMQTEDAILHVRNIPPIKKYNR